MKISRGSFAILVVAICLSPSTALPDFLAPFRSMLGMKHQQQGSSSSNSPYSKPLSSQKDPIASHVNKHFGGGGGGGPPDGDPFNSNFGFGSPPSSGGGHGPSHSNAPYTSGGRGSPFGSSRPSRPVSAVSRPVRQQPGAGYRPGFGGSFGGRPSSFGGNPVSGGPSSSHRYHHPHPQGPPGSSQDDPYKYQDDEGGPSSFSPGPGGPSSSSPYSGGRPGGGPPPFLSQGGPSSSPYRGSGGPGSSRPYSPFSGSNSNSDDGAEDGPQGPGFSGFGSFPAGEGEEDDSPPPRGSGPRGPPRGSGGPPQSFGGFGSDDDGPNYQSSRPSFESSSPGGFQQGGPPSNGEDSNGPSSFFASSPGGGSDYQEQYQEAPRGTRNPQIISSNDANKYPPQLSEDDDQGSPQGGYGGGYTAGGPPPFRGGSGGRVSSSPQSHSSGSPGGAPWGQDGQSSSPFGNSEDGPSSQAPPSYTPRRRHPSRGNIGKVYSSGAYPRPRPVSAGGYQASSDSVQYGKPNMLGMQMSASSSQPAQAAKVPRGQRRRYSAKISGPPQQPQMPQVGQRIIPLVSPKDPNFQASSLTPVSAPFEPDTAASGHEHGGHEGLSHNGDRILYHVGGHKGPHSYRFGYDTGKGYNRLFRFEEKDGKGYVKGKYGFYDKHGKLQVVNYEAHPKHGFHAERANSHH